MKKTVILLISVLIQINSFSQNLDLIVLNDKTLVACKIDSVTDTHIFFKIKSQSDVWVQTKEKLKFVTEYKYGTIDVKNYSFEPGTSIIAVNTRDNRSEKNFEYGVFKKNAVYGAVGTALLWSSVVGYYERFFSKMEPNESDMKLFGRGGFGAYTVWGEGGEFFSIQFGILTGGMNSHLELAAGYSNYLKGDLQGNPLSGTIAYRFQKPNDNLLFRAGVGFPEALFISAGFSF